ncbi:MAG: UDP-3-O-acyl-N-acetylglucosamine deacetylase [bacterium]
MFQRTIRGEVSISGVGLHSGQKVHLRILGASEDSGIVFKRLDLPGKPSMKISVEGAGGAERCTTIGSAAFQLMTVEHFLAAVWSLGIDNLLVEIDGAELPILDGSAQPYALQLRGGEIVAQKKEKKGVYIRKILQVSLGDALLLALPSDELKITYVASFPNSVAGTQFLQISLTEENFVSEIAPARTFGFWEEVEALRKSNLALGGSLENAFLLHRDGYSSPLRFPDEVVRHKVLDLVGDLAVLGRPLGAHILAIRSGHRSNIELVKIIHAEEAAL